MNELEILTERLAGQRDLSDSDLKRLIESPEAEPFLFTEADRIRREHYGDEVYIRGLIEFTNFCKNNCFYCGIRAGNTAAARYRLTKEEILFCCEEGYSLGFRTFVLQGAKTHILPMISCVRSSPKSAGGFPAVPSPFRSEKSREKAIKNILTPAQTAIFCDTKRRTKRITESCTLPR